MMKNLKTCFYVYFNYIIVDDYNIEGIIIKGVCMNEDCFARTDRNGSQERGARLSRK